MEDFKWDYSKSEEVLIKEYGEWCDEWWKENPGKLLPGVSCYALTEPEFVGRFPIRQDIEIIPADKENINIGWSCREYSGAEITKPGSSEPLIKESDLQVGDKIIVPTLFGNHNGVVEKDSYSVLYAKIGENLVADLHFSTDDRRCWITFSTINVRALKNIK
jgi:hypothetical protein